MHNKNYFIELFVIVLSMINYIYWVHDKFLNNGIFFFLLVILSLIIMAIVLIKLIKKIKHN